MIGYENGALAEKRNYSGRYRRSETNENRKEEMEGRKR